VTDPRWRCCRRRTTSKMNCASSWLSRLALNRPRWPTVAALELIDWIALRTHTARQPSRWLTAYLLSESKMVCAALRAPSGLLAQIKRKPSANQRANQAQIIFPMIVVIFEMRRKPFCQLRKRPNHFANCANHFAFQINSPWLRQAQSKPFGKEFSRFSFFAVVRQYIHWRANYRYVCSVINIPGQG